MRVKLFLFFLIFIIHHSFGQISLNGNAVLKVIEINPNLQKIVFQGPPEWKEFGTAFQIGNKFSDKGKLKLTGGISEIEFDVKGSREELNGQPFSFYIQELPLVAIHSLYEYVSTTNNIRNNATLDLIQIKLFSAEVGLGTDWVLSIQISQGPGMLPYLQKLSESNLRNGTIYLMEASHQDTGWEDTPAQCEIDRDQKIISPALAMLKENKDFVFNVENMLSLMEYLERHPEKKEEIHQLTKEGRLSWGGAFNQAYEEMYSGESLARQFYFGRLWFKNQFPGLDTRTVWNVDVPGRTLQAPQIMAKAGIKYLLLSRQQQGLFEWQSPDGSKVKVYSPGDYGETWRQLRKSNFRAFRHFADYALNYQIYNKPEGYNAAIPLMANKDMSPPFLYKEIIEEWNALDHWKNPNGEKIELKLPKIKFATPEGFFKALEINNPKLPVIKGERPNVWVYIHGPTHHKMLSASREGGTSLVAAEKFATFNALLEKNWEKYPQHKLNQAWRDHIYPDHGMGGKNGHITDQVFLDKSLMAKQIGDSILWNALKGISSKIDFGDHKGIPLVVFNTMSKERTNTVQVTVNSKEKRFSHFKLTDNLGKEISYQMVNSENKADGDISKMEIVFLAENVPSLGYKTYFVVPASGTDEGLVQKRDQASVIENDYYQIKLGQGGILQIKDKELNWELFKSNKFLGGELFTLQSEGNGAGEFAQVQQPTMEGFEKMSEYQTVWKRVDQGSLYQSVEMIQKINHVLVKQKIILYHKIKKIDVQLSLLNWDGALFREFRLAFPLNMENGQVVYEVPFGKVEIGKDELPGVPGERYQVKASEIRPRGILNWIGAYNDKVGVTISSSVAAWDYLDPTDEPVEYPILQPILLASRRSCHSLGNWYLQEGDHHFSFSITSHPSDWKRGYQKALEQQEPLIGYFDPEKKERELPMVLGFMGTNKSNVTISTIKKSETGENVIIRFCEMEGVDTRMNLDSFFPVKNLVKCSLIEEKKEGSYKKSQIEIGKYAVDTFIIH